LTLTLPVARTLDGKYRLDRLIGRGGMGAVYEARDLRLGRLVAVKVMLGGAFGHESALRRFRREAQAVARLSHPNIVALYDFGELEGGGAYLVMELLHGATLRSEMKRARIFAPGEAADWFEQMLDGLAAAHEQGVVHRDFKPENILGVRRTGGSLAVKILDFGLAKIQPLPAASATSHGLTESGVMLGTLAYMAPEQLLGQEVDARADVYAAGVILVEMLTRARPFADGADIRQDYRLPPGVPNHAALDAVLQRCLAMAPHARFPSAAELRSALVPALRGFDTASGRMADNS
jgi:serine/threonine-protein kinase